MGLRDRLGLGRSTAVEADADEAPPGVVGNPTKELRNFRRQHKWDPFLDNDKLETIDSALDSANIEKQAAVDESLIQENSPYPEVRSSVPPTDDPSMPVDTIRAWVIGAVLCTIVAACNVLLSLRRGVISISPTVVQLVAYPIGCFAARVLPNRVFRVLGREFNLNPGPFNVKEHTIITMMTAAGTGYSYALEILLAQEVYYGQHFRWGFQILLILSTQAMGFGVAGIARRFLVWPSSMVWPANLVTTTVMYSLHNHEPADPATSNGWRIGRYKFFLIVGLATFIWEWVPQVFAQFLQLFLLACFIAPENVVVNQIFGGQTGLGILPISFDWTTISGFLGSPLQTPAFAIANVAAGLLLMTVGAVGLAWGGPEYYRYLPISANANWDRYARRYNTTRILTPDFTVNETAYQEYSPILLGATFSLSYGLSFATLISTVAHVALFYGADVWRRARSSKSEEPDIHLKLMRRYKEAPEWWFLTIFVFSFAFGMIASQVWDTHMPWWSYIMCILIGLVLFIPIGMVQAITNQQTGLNVITEMIIGYMLPGRPLAMMLFKSWGYMLSANGLNYISDMKVGHYMKIPPRSMFAAQAFAVIWLSFVQTATYNFLIGNIPEICTEDQPQGLTCPNARTFYNASVIWGVIGPARVFGVGGIYAWTNWFWFIGVALPVIQYLLARRYPRSFLRYIVFPAVFGAAGLIPPATLYYLLQWVIVGFIFNWWIRRRYFGWWTEYNYVLSGALDIGSRLCVVVVGLALGLGNANFPSWWGNTAPFNTLDANGTAVTKKFIKGVTKPLGPETW
ncbi:Sexual differentiation process protein isp4 [Tolypocladium paradoxum]|uniref:Sexual differentiation process protein isp4 n=1 Tax=Tolypocladium paradoxum TaxID=94208 RepID=A0A2S4KP21_9HYPO|nr:Sexual differentiation process protein isp4 [Tolypocladium paradoxum]